MVKLQHLDHGQAKVRPACDLGPLAGIDGYELWGDDRSGRQRKALPVANGKPVAMLLPVFDLLQAVEAAKTGKAAATEGYLLAVVAKTDVTGWRFYSGMPDAAVLKADMVRALAGQGTPIFRNGAGGKTDLFLPKG